MEVIESTKLPGLKLIRPDIFEDFRGDYAMTYNKELYRQHGIDVEFVEHCVSTSMKGVIRGVHTDYACDKLYEIVHGRAYYVFVDCREPMPTFGRWEAFILSGENHLQVFKPACYGVAFQALTDDTVLRYMQSEYYEPKRQETWRWDDPGLGISWPIRPPLLSRRDGGQNG